MAEVESDHALESVHQCGASLSEPPINFQMQTLYNVAAVSREDYTAGGTGTVGGEGKGERRVGG